MPCSDRVPLTLKWSTLIIQMQAYDMAGAGKFLPLSCRHLKHCSRFAKQYLMIPFALLRTPARSKLLTGSASYRSLLEVPRFGSMQIRCIGHGLHVKEQGAQSLQDSDKDCQAYRINP